MEEKTIKLKDSFIAIFVIGIVLLIILPVSTKLLDILLIINIAASLIIILIAMYVKSPLELTSFPTIILIATLFRLALNISSTTLILGSNGNAGDVIKTFGDFVIQGNPVVGLIIFMIIMIIQLVVITKGSERISEVSARFTLDSMPGKQMAIDADLNAGLIDEKQAKQRREDIQREADFYGSMDGASKFVKGDAIAGIVITFINLLGGIIIGVVIGKQSFGQAVNVYTLASVGDGLVSQIPALLISTASGIILSRKASSDTLNREIVSQLTSQAIVLFIGGAALILMMFIPGLPKIPLMVVGSFLLILGYRIYSDQNKPVPVTAPAAALPKVEEYDITEYIFTDPIVVEFGYSLVQLIDKKQGGKLLDRLVMIRRQTVVEWGVILPKIRVKDNHTLMPNQYSIKVKGFNVASGEILPDYYLAMTSDEHAGEIDGIETTEPTYGIPAYWIRPDALDKAEMQGYTVVDAVSVIATHISKIITDYSYELVGLEEVKELVEALQKRYPALVENVVPEIITLRTLQKVLCNLLEEGVKIKNLPKILEILGDYGRTVADADELTEFVRQGIKKEICSNFIHDDQIDLLVINPELEQRLTDTLVTRDKPDGKFLRHDEIKQFIQNANEQFNSASDLGYSPVLVTTPVLRSYLKGLLKQNRCDIDVLSVLEIDEMCDIKIVGNINI
ncbi:flagellar biosynthesis protein FlhA [Clostridium sp. 'deep sea']|uniref:flagellar biosynthesis protein FlhA n=1 Tax=Clostridium sp. 'deep sea' TaxID=2779445 RepID=UPI0018964D66|nr:flagellar biosynthesis protein FlhA [Clostridium sp. 'deep sea']QOR35357.1 flagellar biosynthesis protein FlhA [Clostridium sp. 'deep sea']